MAPHQPKPTILCFHGSGSNGMIFNVQLARLARLLRSNFDLICLDGPFEGQPGPGILPFFEGCGPYTFWTPADRNGNHADGTGIESVMHPEVVDEIMDAVKEVEEAGGEVVGAIGFSQGSRVVAGLLKAQEAAQRTPGNDDGIGGLKTDLKFGVVFMGSYPPPLVPVELHESSGSGEDGKPITPVERIRTPTLHVQGVRDPWSWAGKKMFDECYDPGTTKMVNIQTEHHMPVSVDENESIHEAILDLWHDTM